MLASPPSSSFPAVDSITSLNSPRSNVSQVSPSSISDSPGLTTNGSTGSSMLEKPSSCAARSVNGVYSNDEDDFCAQLSMACGTRENPVPKAHSGSNVLSPPSFDTEFFTDYRDPIFNVTDEEFNLPELTPDDLLDNISPNLEPSTSSKDEEVVPADNKPLMTCTALWDRISMHPKFGDIDIDGLCSELRIKAKCSESGVVVTEADLNAVLQKIDSTT